jgi:bile acid:Na+ symporter, BASS family
LDAPKRFAKGSASMSLHNLVLLALKASICLSVFAIGLEAKPQDALFLLGRPSQLARSFLAMGVIMPVAVAIVVKLFDFRQSVEVALVALAISPVPPLLPKKQVKADGDPSYAIGLLILSAVVAIVLIPVAIEALGIFFRMPIHMKPWPIARLALFTVLIPLGLGMAARQFFSAIAIKVSRPLAMFAAILLVASALVVLFALKASIWELLGDGTIVAIAAFILMGLAVGHWLGGPDPHDRTVLALATAARHPAIALTIATTNFPEDRAIAPAILLYLILGTVLAIPYVQRRKRDLS